MSFESPLSYTNYLFVCGAIILGMVFGVAVMNSAENSYALLCAVAAGGIAFGMIPWSFMVASIRPAKQEVAVSAAERKTLPRAACTVEAEKPVAALFEEALDERDVLVARALEVASGVVSGLFAWLAINYYCSGIGLAPEAAPPELVHPVTSELLLAAALVSCVVGHTFNPWLGFRGGNSAFVAVGCLATMLAPLYGPATLVVFLLVWKFKGESMAIGALMICGVCFGIVAFWDSWLALGLLALALLVVACKEQ